MTQEAFALNFCPKCGGPLRLTAVPHDRKERLVCQQCSYIFYQDPKVVAGTIPRLPEGRTVLVRRGISPGKGLWTFPGGYMDRGETVEEAARRETREECGLEVRLTGLLGIYSYAEAPAVIIVYQAEVTGGELQVDHESLEVRAFAAADIPWASLAFPSTAAALQDWVKQQS